MPRRARKVRRGLGKGKGKGYKNIIPKDVSVHSQSAKGIKQPQRVNVPLKPAIPSVKLEPEEMEALEMLGYENFYPLRNLLIGQHGKITDVREEVDGVWMIELEDDAEYYVFENEARAERFAEDRVEQDLEDNPELFTQSWLENYVYITDTDRRLIAQEESDNYVDEVLDEDEIIKESDYEDEYDELQTQKEVWENRFEEGLSNKNEQKLQEKIDDVEKKQEELIDKAREEARSDKYDEIYEALADPIEYFVNEQGMYSKEDLFKQSFIRIDTDEATSDAVRTDGWQHFVATYDGDSSEVPDTDLIIARVN